VCETSRDLMAWDLIVSLRNLSTYRKKRDFERPRSPAARQGRAFEATGFVIQKPTRPPLHYDLRLEFDGVSNHGRSRARLARSA